MVNYFEKNMQDVFERALNIIQNHKSVIETLGQNLKRNDAGLNVITASALPEPLECRKLGPELLEIGEGNLMVLEKNAERTVLYITMKAGTTCHNSTAEGFVRLSVVYGSFTEIFSATAMKIGETAHFEKGKPRQFSTTEDSAYIWVLLPD